MTIRECYEILELPFGASLEDVKRAFRKLSLIYHPDRWGEAPPEGVVLKYRQIVEAYRRLLEWFRGGSGPEELWGYPDKKGTCVRPRIQRMRVDPDIEKLLEGTDEEKIAVLQRIPSKARGNPRIRKVLLWLLESKTGKVKQWAAWALGRAGVKEAEERLLKCISDSNPIELRKTALIALGELRSRRASEEAAKIVASSDEPDDIRDIALWVVGKGGTEGEAEIVFSVWRKLPSHLKVKALEILHNQLYIPKEVMVQRLIYEVLTYGDAKAFSALYELLPAETEAYVINLWKRNVKRDVLWDVVQVRHIKRRFVVELAGEGETFRVFLNRFVEEVNYDPEEIAILYSELPTKFLGVLWGAVRHMKKKVMRLLLIRGLLFREPSKVQALVREETDLGGILRELAKQGLVFRLVDVIWSDDESMSRVCEYAKEIEELSQVCSKFLAFSRNAFEHKPPSHPHSGSPPDPSADVRRKAG